MKLPLPLRRYDIDSLDNRDPEAIERLCRLYHEPLRRYFRFECGGIERVPPGPALYVGNHSGAMLIPDSFLLFSTMFFERGMADLPYGLGHEVAISIPGLMQIVVPLGAVRASHENAHRLFSAGHKVMVYPGGDVDSHRPWRDRDRIVFGGRRGYIRLALRERVPIVPVVTAGAQEVFLIVDDLRWLARLTRADKVLRTKVWPLMVSIPWGVTLGPSPFYVPAPSRILSEFLEPIHLDPDGPEAAEDEEHVRRCAERVETAMQDALTRLAARRRELGGWRR